MHLGNPAIYECKKNPSGIHAWLKKEGDKTATCKHCKITLNEEHTREVFSERQECGDK